MKIGDNYVEPITIQCPKTQFSTTNSKGLNWQVKVHTMHFKGCIGWFEGTVISQNTGIYRGYTFFHNSIEVQ